MPGQSPTAFAVELLGVGGAVWLFATGVFTVRRPAIDQLAPIAVNAVAAQLATLPVIAAGPAYLPVAAADCTGWCRRSSCSWELGS